MITNTNTHSLPGDFRGIHVALVTPMTATGALDENTLGAFVEHLIGRGVHGLIPLGSTGEYYALSGDERERVLRVTLAAAAGRVPVLAGANAGSTRDVVANARKAEVLGCAGVLLAAPYYSLPAPDELAAHFRAVDDAIGIPIMLYNYPGRTGVDMQPEWVASLCAELKNVCYIKDSTGDMTRISSLLRLCGDRLGVFCGCDTLAFESFMLGVRGWVSGVPNVTPKSFVQLYDLAVVRQDYAAARALYFKMLPLLSHMESGRYTQLVKAGCRIKGVAVGAPRAPLCEAPAGAVARLRECLAGLD
jgi:4-hydroxy-tetrahydrodipicolinate synthase